MKTAVRTSPGRSVAFRTLRRVFEEGAYADRGLLAEAGRAGLRGRDRAFAMRLAYGAVQRRATLDHVAERLAGRPMERLDPPVVAALRLGLLQLLFLDAVPDHAAVGETVELVKGPSPGGARLVNAVLRRAAKEGPAIVASMDDTTPAGAALRHSHPVWIAELLWDALGAADARSLLAADNEPAETAVRANTLVTTREQLARELEAAGAETTAAGYPPESIVLTGAFDAHGSGLWERGALTPQSRAAAAVAHVVDPRPGERVLDLCAAPGGKTTHLAALMEGEGDVVALERHRGRADALGDTVARLHAGRAVQVQVGDARELVAGPPFDRVLVDPPCSGLGTLRSRPDLRWRVGPRDVVQLAAGQAEILAAAARATKPGGVLVYSTCTISPAENERVVDAFLAARPDFSADDLSSDLGFWEHPRVARHLMTLPHRDATDGFFIARLRRAS